MGSNVNNSLDVKSTLKYKTFSNTFWKFLERFLAQGISLIVSIIIARLLLPSDYSVVAIVTIFFAFANVLISGGLNTALIQKKNADKIDYSTILFVSLIISVIVYLILFFTAPYIANRFNDQSLVLIIRIMGIVLPITAIKSIWSAYISSNLLFKKFFFATLGGTIASAVVGIVMAVKGFGPWALVAQQMTNTIIDTVILIIITRIGILPKIDFIRLKSLFKYGWKILLTSLIGTTYTELTPLIIGMKFKKEDLSFYEKGRTFPNTLVSSINYTLSSVLFPVLTKVQEDKKIVLKYTRLFIKTASYMVFPILLGLFAISDNFVYVILTPKWMEASFYIKVICLGCLADVIAVGNCESIKAIGKSGTYLIMEIIKKTLYFTTIILFAIYSPNPNVMVYSAIVCAVISLIVNCIPNQKILNYKIKDQIIDLLPNLLLSITMVAAVLGVEKLFVYYSNIQYGWLPLVIEIFVGIIVYFGLSIVLKNSSFVYLTNTIKSFRYRK